MNSIIVGSLVAFVVALIIGYHQHFVNQHIRSKRAKILLFDGVCNVCNVYVNFIIKHDPTSQYYFVPLRSTVGQKLLNMHHIDPHIDSLVLIDYADELVTACQSNELDKFSNPRCPVYVRSTGAIVAVASLGFPWSVLSIAMVLPLPIRDAGYRLFASVRYQLFGKTEACMAPSRATRARFLATR